MATRELIGGDGEGFGPYLVFERIGVGGMATVHRAKERGIEGFERMVALKRLLPHLAEDEKFVRAFVREAKLASMLQHPNIIQLYELGRVGTVYFISMEIVEGRDIRQILRQARKITGPPPIPVIIGLLCQVCEALEYAHTRVQEDGTPLGLVHRDVSPSNLLVSRSGHVKVIDFGIAKAKSVNLRTQTGRVKGKMAYMSPEAIQGDELDARSDLFSTGVLAHELLTARPLFATRNDYQTLMKVQKAVVAPPSAHNRDCPPELDEFVLKALARNRDRRFQSAGEMRDALDKMRKHYSMGATTLEVADWMEWAFALELPPSAHAGLARATTSTPVHVPTPKPGVSRPQIVFEDIYEEAIERGDQPYTPTTGSAAVPLGDVALPAAEDDDEVMEIAWGGRSDAVPVVLEDVPDVSEKIFAPGLQTTPAGDAGSTVVSPPPAPRLKPPKIPPAWATGTVPPGQVMVEDELELRPPTDNGTEPLDPELFNTHSDTDEVRVDLSMPVVRFKAKPTPVSKRLPLPAASDEDDEEAPAVIHQRRPRATAQTEFGAGIVARKRGRWGRAATAILAIAGAAGGAAYLLARDSGKATTATTATVSDDAATLKFVVEPEDAEIQIEDIGTHAGSPYKLELEPKTYRIVVSRAGYNSWVSSIEVEKRETQTIRVALEHGGSEKASVAVQSTPTGLPVSVDGKAVEGTTPLSLDLEPGEHEIAIVGTAGPLWSHRFEAAANTHYEFHPTTSAARSRRRAPSRHRERRHHRESREAPAVLESPDTMQVVEQGAPAASAQSLGLTSSVPIALDPSQPPPIAPRKPKPTSGPRVIPPNAVKKVSGSIPKLRATDKAVAPARVSAKMCIGRSGRVDSVTIISNVPDTVRGSLTRALKKWRYRPYRVGGEAKSACFAIGLHTR